MNTLIEIADIIKNNSTFAVTYHFSPDGDACGSVTALVQGLRQIGKEAYIISKDELPYNLGFLPISEEISGEIIKPKSNDDVLIALDCGTIERLSCDTDDFTGLIINIDHHLSNDIYGKYNFVQPTASATCEIVYSLLTQLNVNINKEIATSLYTGIVTDTGSFRHSNVTVNTHMIVSELLKYNINHTKIHSNLYDNKPFEKLKLLGKIFDNCELLFNNKLIFLGITNKMFEELNIDSLDTGDIVTYGLQVQNVEVSVLLKETDMGIKASLIFKNDFDVRKIAEIFEGGGHTKAAGILFKSKNFEEVKEKLLNEFQKELV